MKLSGQAPGIEPGAEAAVDVTCVRCGAVEQVPLAKPATTSAISASEPGASDDAAPSKAPLPGERRCPKCEALVGDRAACPSCGLASSRMASFSASREGDIPDPVRAAWDAVTESPEAWASQARHDAFVQLVAAAAVFAWAAGQYQEIRRRRPDDAIALRQLERVRRTAEASMLATTTVRDVKQSPYRSATAILVMLVVVLVAGALYATFMREARSPASTITPVAPAPHHRPGAR